MSAGGRTFWGADHEEVALRLDSHWRSGELCEVWEKGGHACSGADRELERDQQGSVSLAALRDACTSKASLGKASLGPSEGYIV